MSSEECEELKAQGGQMGKEVVDQLWILSKDEALREIAMVEDRQKRDLKAVKETMYEEGLEDGMEKGMEKGIVQGMEKGIIQGIEKGQEKIISQLLRANMNVEQICQVTDLSEQEVLKIQSKILILK